MYTVEGCSSISDANGDFLFYTNGETVYNKNHQIMVNGDNLNGEQSATQSSIIVPKPGSTSIYYLFTIAAFASPKGMQYSVINMALQGGLGEVISKNTPLITPVIEQITAVLHANKTDYWIISHEWNSSKFYAYLLTSAGLSSTPVISDEFIVRQSGGSPGDVAGYMKISPQGDKIASVDRTAKAVCVYSFDNNTGKIGIRNGYVTGVEPEPPYGIEFSPDGTKLYYDYLRSNNLYQLDLLSGNFDVVVGLIKHGNSCNSNTDVIAGGMQLGPDGKIYLAKACDSLGVVNNPNLKGILCTYIDAGVYLGGIHQSIYGLPNFPNKYGVSTPPTLVATIPPSHTICAVGDSVNLGGNPTATGDNPPFTYQWSSNPVGFSSILDNPKVGPKLNTTYTLTVTDATGVTAEASTIVNIDKIKAYAGKMPVYIPV